jgi:hypothetical protein
MTWVQIPSHVLIILLQGGSSPVARQAHNLKVVGSNPTPAPISHHKCCWLHARLPPLKNQFESDMMHHLLPHSLMVERVLYEALGPL